MTNCKLNNIFKTLCNDYQEFKKLIQDSCNFYNTNVIVLSKIQNSLNNFIQNLYELCGINIAEQKCIVEGNVKHKSF